MAKRQTKAEAILSEARERRAKAQDKWNEAIGAARIAEAVYQSETASYYALERALAPKPRKKAVKEVPAQKDLPTETKEPQCGICANPADYQDHFQPSPNYHPFEAPAVKAKQKLAVAK